MQKQFSKINLSLAVWFLFVGALVFSLTLAGCGGGGGGGSDTTTTTTGTGGGGGIVTGRVLDSADGDAPVGGATVRIGTVSGVTTRVDQASADNVTGSFRLQNVPVGATEAVVTVAGNTQTIAFSPPIANGANGPIELIINIGQIRGRILDTDGRPAANAFVSILSTGDNVQTAADGMFRVDNIPLGATEVSAVKGTSSATKPVTVVRGVTEAGDLRLVADTNPNPPPVPYTIVGAVRLSDSPAASAGAGTAVALLRNGVQIEQTQADAGGEYRFYVPVGTYAVRGVRNGYQDAQVPAVVTNPNTPLRADLTLTKR